MVAALYMMMLLIGYTLLLRAWQAASAAQWLAWATAVMMIQMGILWWGLPYNHHPAESMLLPFLGYSNGMTLTRGLLTCMLAGFLFSPRPAAGLGWAPALLYTLARLIDYFDGYVARVNGRETKLGAILDMEFDGLGLLIASALAIQYGQLPTWYLILGLGRQLFIAGIWLRQRWGKPVSDLPPSDHRRLIAGFQTGFISVTLWPALSPQITMLASLLFAVPLVVSFGRDWLVVSQVIDAGSPAYQAVRQAAKRLLEGWLPLATRMAGTILGILIIGREAPDFLGWMSYLGNVGLAPWTLLLMAFVLLCTLAILLFALGIIGRAIALILLALACLDILATSLRWSDNALLLACAIVVLHLGSGKFALWQPEERILQKRLGA
jgi:CDP-diacylglycerol--glycerol-3-phosphate 3-phosphatidyltransferase